MLTEERADRRRRHDPDAQLRRRRFEAGRAAALDRLVHAGMPRTFAERWIAAWDVSTAELIDFRAAPDFWELGYRFAVEEYRRGHPPPVFVGT